MALHHESIAKSIGYQVGDIKLATYSIPYSAFSTTEPEIGWFLLNGPVLSQASYPKLFARFGTNFNIGSEGIGNFRLPNHTEGVFPVAKGLSTFTTYAARGGEINHTLVATELAAHTHSDTLAMTASAHGHTGSATTNVVQHTHTYPLAVLVDALHAGAAVGTFEVVGTEGVSSGGAVHTHTVTISSSNGTSTTFSATETYTKTGSVTPTAAGGPHNNMMPYVVIGGLLVKHD